MNKDNTFGKKLQQIRKAKGLTQEKLAELAGVHEKHISKLELGTYKPSFDTLNKVLTALDLKIDNAKVLEMIDKLTDRKLIQVEVVKNDKGLREEVILLDGFYRRLSLLMVEDTN